MPEGMLVAMESALSEWIASGGAGEAVAWAWLLCALGLILNVIYQTARVFLDAPRDRHGKPRDW